MFDLPEFFWIAVLAFILFGSKKLPEFARSAGEAMKEFKKAAHELQNDPPVVAEQPRRLEQTSETETVAHAS